MLIIRGASLYLQISGKGSLLLHLLAQGLILVVESCNLCLQQFHSIVHPVERECLQKGMVYGCHSPAEQSSGCVCLCMSRSGIFPYVSANTGKVRPSMQVVTRTAKHSMQQHLEPCLPAPGLLMSLCHSGIQSNLLGLDFLHERVHLGLQGELCRPMAECMARSGEIGT